MSGFLGFPDQPDFMEMVDAFNPNVPKILMQHWIDGDEDERAEIDRGLARSWERQRKEQEAEHHKTVFGAYSLF
jgi:hypothetical protein